MKVINAQEVKQVSGGIKVCYMYKGHKVCVGT